MPAEKTVTETYLEIGCKQGKNGIMIGQAYSYSEDGNSVDLYTIRQSEYEKLTGEKQISTMARSLPGIRLKGKQTH